MMGFEPEVFRRRLREAMDKKGWSRADLAARTTMSEMTIRNWKTRLKAGPAAASIWELCEALEVSADWLLGRTDDDR